MEADKAADEIPTFEIEYENLDMPPRYVEGIQGIFTAQGGVQCYLFSDYVVPPSTIVPDVRRQEHGEEGVSVSLRVQDPYGAQSGVTRIVRRVEANIILSEPALQVLHSWLSQMIGQLENRRAASAQQDESD